MTITGRQIREARNLLKLTRSVLAQMVDRITTLAITRAEEAEDEPTLSSGQAVAVRQALERAGVEFILEKGGGAGVRLRKSEV